MALLDRKTIEVGEGMFVDVDPKKETVKVTIGDESRIVKRVDLWAMCFAIADAKTQESLMPVRQTTVTEIVKVHAVELKKDMKKGEILKVRCRTNVPQLIEEGLKGSLRPL